MNKGHDWQSHLNGRHRFWVCLSCGYGHNSNMIPDPKHPIIFVFPQDLNLPDLMMSCEEAQVYRIHKE